jgi:hypothetical protein
MGFAERRVVMPGHAGGDYIAEPRANTLPHSKHCTCDPESVKFFSGPRRVHFGHALGRSGQRLFGHRDAFRLDETSSLSTIWKSQRTQNGISSSNPAPIEQTRTRSQRD